MVADLNKLGGIAVKLKDDGEVEEEEASVLSSEESSIGVPPRVRDLYLDGELLVTLESGVGFGELGLVRKQPRSASIVATPGTCLLRVRAADYNRIMKFQIKGETDAKQAFLLGFELFGRNCSREDVQRLADKLIFVEYKAGDILYRAQERSRHVFFIKTGSVQVIRALAGTRGDARMVNLPDQSRGDMFGFSTDTREMTQETVIAGDGGVEVGKLPRHDLLHWDHPLFHRRLQEWIYQTAIPEDRLEELYAEQTRKARWSRFRKRIVEEVVGE